MGVIAALASLGKRIGCVAGGETIERGILDARVTHIRHAERRYVLSHRLSYLHIGLGDLGRLPRPWFGYNRRAVAVIRDRDYGPGKLRLGEWIAEALRAWAMQFIRAGGSLCYAAPRRRSCLQSGQLLVLSRSGGQPSRRARRGEQHIRRAPLLSLPQARRRHYRTWRQTRGSQSPLCLAVPFCRRRIHLPFP